MGKVTIRDPLPGETCFGGGRGILVPFRPERSGSSGARSTATTAAPTQTDRLPDPGTRAYAELHGKKYDPDADPQEIMRLLLAGEPLPARSRQLLGMEDDEPTDPDADQGPDES